MPDQAAVTFLPGAIGLGRLRVYDSAGPDRLAGGAPHVHLASTEAYYVLAGRGSVQTLCVTGLGESELEEGKVVWFSPGVIHRLVNADGKLEVLVIGQNGELSMGEDVVLTFPPEYIVDATRYAEAMSPVDDLAAAMRRRDLAVDGFNGLRADYQFKGKAVLDKFYAAAGKLAKPRAPEWYRRWSTTASAAASATSVHLNNLRHGHVGHLTQGRVGVAREPNEDRRRAAACGTLGVYQPEGSAS